jgi:hypothetical protein
VPATAELRLAFCVRSSCLFSLSNSVWMAAQSLMFILFCRQRLDCPLHAWQPTLVAFPRRTSPQSYSDPHQRWGLAAAAGGPPAPLPNLLLPRYKFPIMPRTLISLQVARSSSCALSFALRTTRRSSSDSLSLEPMRKREAPLPLPDPEEEEEESELLELSESELEPSSASEGVREAQGGVGLMVGTSVPVPRLWALDSPMQRSQWEDLAAPPSLWAAGVLRCRLSDGPCW